METFTTTITDTNIIAQNVTATNPSPSSHIPVGLNFLFPNFDSKI